MEKLHIPYKKWSDVPHEEQNYLAIERWTERLQHCGGPEGGPYTPVVNCVASRAKYHGTGIATPGAVTINFLTQMTQVENIGTGITPTATGLQINSNGMVIWEASLDCRFSPGLFGGQRLCVTGLESESQYPLIQESFTAVPGQLRQGGGYYKSSGTIIGILLRPWSADQPGNYVNQELWMNLTHIHFTGVDDT
jgi:hypothetical protein